MLHQLYRYNYYINLSGKNPYLFLYNPFIRKINFTFMNKKEVTSWANRPANKRVLLSFTTPKTTKEAQNELSLRKLKTRPFVEKGLLIPLNPKATKGRLYILTEKGRKSFNLTLQEKTLNNIDWDLIGWVMASPLQRLVVLQTMAIDSAKRTSEEIRQRGSRLNPCLSRLSTKGILKELINKGVVETEMLARKRYYWLNEKGWSLVNNISNPAAS
jgi:predicted transcriptional regulator